VASANLRQAIASPTLDMIGRRLFVLLACLFVVMIGFGITLPVLPFYVERLAQAEGATREAIVLQRQFKKRVDVKRPVLLGGPVGGAPLRENLKLRRKVLSHDRP
jgi:hypothetical protein